MRHRIETVVIIWNPQMTSTISYDTDGMIVKYSKLRP